MTLCWEAKLDAGSLIPTELCNTLTPNPLPPRERKGSWAIPLNGLQSLCGMAMGFLGA